MTRNATKMIEDQIALELEKLNAFMTFESEKPAIIQRIADLKALLDAPKTEELNQPSPRELLSDLITAFRRR